MWSVKNTKNVWKYAACKTSHLTPERDGKKMKNESKGGAERRSEQEEDEE